MPPYHAAMSAPDGSDALLDRAVHIADEVLFPAAQRVDRSSRIPSSHIAALAEAGLFGLAGPPGHAGDEPSATSVRRIMAAIAGGCASTFFVWAQHHGVVRTLRSSPNKALVDRWLDPLCAGFSVAGVAFAHLRRQGPPAIRAVATPDGWQFSGVAPWATSWGIAERFAVAAVTADDRIVWGLLPGVDSPDGSFRAQPLALPVLQSTGTVVLHFDEHLVADDHVLSEADLAEWQLTDRSRAAPGQTGVLGVADRAIRQLADIAANDRAARSAATQLRSQLDERWRVDDELSKTPATSETQIAAASLHRAHCLELGRRSTTAYLAASGGRGMDLAHPAQRLARETDFFVIQAQTGDGREAVLRSVSGGSSPDAQHPPVPSDR